MANRETKDATVFLPPPRAAGVLQRKCAACGTHTVAGGDCEECKKKNSTGLQAKLTVAQAGDAYEQEADRVADQVLSASSDRALTGAPMQIQRFAEQAGAQTDSPASSVGQTLAESGTTLDLG